jgi:dihydroorotate dehydrogenase (NAD+) catalytic subunit
MAAISRACFGWAHHTHFHLQVNWNQRKIRRNMKRDLYFSKPIMNAAGLLGFSPDFRNLEELGSLNSFGAFVTNPISLRPRVPTAHPAVIEFPGGFLLHSGLPNPGLAAVVKKHAARWNRADTPIIVHLMADRPEETQHMVRMLEGIENVMAVELGFAPLLSDDILLLNLDMCAGELPLIFSLPPEQILRLGPRLMDGGAAAISMAHPRGALMRDGKLVTGRLFGRSQFPRSLEIVRSAAMIGLPVIGSGGVWTEQDAADMLSAGAMAVQMDASLWLPGRNTATSQNEKQNGIFATSGL